MKKITKILGIALLAFGAVALSSCTDEPEYTPADPVDGPQIYFSPDSPTTVELSTEESSFDVTVYRETSSDAVSVTLGVSEESGLFTIPSTVSFAAGETQTTLTIGYSYNEDDFPYGTFYDITLSIPDGYNTPYGLADYEFEAGLSEPWISLGNCTYRDDFITTIFAVDNYEYEVEIQENQVHPGLFRLVYPYDGKYPANEDYGDGTADWDLTQTYYLEVNAEDPDGVYIEMQDLGMDWGYGHFWVWSMADYYYQNGNSWEAIKAAGYCGTYDGETITFPAESLLCTMPDYYGWSFYPANNYGMFRIVMPGVVLSDYSVDVTYGGKSSDNDGNGGVIATVSLGEDADYAEVYLVSGKDVDAALAAVEAGSVVGYSVSEDGGSVTIPCSESGFYILVAQSYAGGSVEETATCSFYYSVPAEAWVKYGSGTYTYDLYWSGEDIGLNLYQSATDPNRFKITDWGAGTDLVFYWDQDTDDIFVDDQYVVYNSYYGPVNVIDYADYVGVPYAYSYYYNGVFHFCLVYYCDAGYFGYGYGETFTLNQGWTSLGYCEYTDDFITEFMNSYAAGEEFSADYAPEEDLEYPTYEVEIQESDSTPGLFRLVNPYDGRFPYNGEGDWDDSQNYYIEINATDPDGVYIELQPTGCDWGFGEFYVYSIASYFMESGYTLDAVKADGWTGTYDGETITFPQKALATAFLGDINDFWQVNYTKNFKIEFPADASAQAVSQKSVAASSDKSLKASTPTKAAMRKMPKKMTKEPVRAK